MSVVIKSTEEMKKFDRSQMCLNLALMLPSFSEREKKSNPRTFGIKIL
jgi:hypothetical protein